MTSKAWQDGAWRSIWAIFAALVVFGLVMQVIGPTLTPRLTGGWEVAAGLVLAILPAVLWLLIFRRLDRLAPEPHYHLFGTMVLGALVASAIGEPLRRLVFGLDLWHEERWQWAVPVYALTQGVILALAIYLSIRFSVFMLDEFDERTDGIMYGAAAGLGVAVSYNLHYLIEAGGLTLDVGLARIIIAALVIASVGGVVGYGLGQVRFERHSIFYLPGILLFAALLTGIYEWLSSEAISRSIGYSGWISVLIAAAFGGLLFGAVDIMAHRAIRETLAVPRAGAASPGGDAVVVSPAGDAAVVGPEAARIAPVAPARRQWLPATPFGGRDGVTVADLVVIGGGILLLIGGWALQRAHDTRLGTATAAGIEVAYPERWLPLPALPPAVAQWTDNDGSGATLTLYSSPVPEGENAVLLGSPNPASGQAAYTPLSSESATIGEVAAVRSDYAFARQQVASATPPEIVRGRELTWTADGQQYALVLEAPASEWDRVAPLFDEIARATVRNQGGAS